VNHMIPYHMIPYFKLVYNWNVNTEMFCHDDVFMLPALSRAHLLCFISLCSLLHIRCPTRLVLVVFPLGRVYAVKGSACKVGLVSGGLLQFYQLRVCAYFPHTSRHLTVLLAFLARTLDFDL